MKLFNSFFQFLIEIYRRRALLLQLAKRDFQSRYLGSALGVFWGYIQPSITIGVLLFVYQYCFRVQPVKDVPYVLWFITGIVPWFFLAEGINSSTGSILEYNYLVKKVAFRVSLLPIIKVISALLIHVFFVAVLFALVFGFGYEFHWQYLQVFYYLFGAVILLLGIGWLTSSLVVFLKDIGQFIGMILNFGFWLTPVMWNINQVPEKYQFWFHLNPACYVVEGYRDSFLYHRWFWERDMIGPGISFWLCTLFLFVGGALVFRQLKNHFADVL